MGASKKAFEEQNHALCTAYNPGCNYQRVYSAKGAHRKMEWHALEFSQCGRYIRIIKDDKVCGQVDLADKRIKRIEKLGSTELIFTSFDNTVNTIDFSQT